MKMGIIVSPWLDKDQVFSTIGDHIHSLETEDKVIDTILIGPDKNNSDKGIVEFVTSLGWKYRLEILDGNDSVVNESDVLMVIWTGEQNAKTAYAIEDGISRGIKVLAVTPERVKVV